MSKTHKSKSGRPTERRRGRVSVGLRTPPAADRQFAKPYYKSFFILFFILGSLLRILLCWSNPPGNFFDNHFDPILLIMKTGTIPGKNDCWQCYHPPVFYWISAMAGHAPRFTDAVISPDSHHMRAGKGDKDRHTTLPAVLKEPLLRHLDIVKRQHENDIARGVGRVALPDALERKYPNAGKEWGWQWVFPATSHFTDRITGEKRRHHLHESVLQRAFKEARLKAIFNRLLVIRCDILLRLICCRMAMTFGPFRSWGHKDVSTTMIYTHVLNRGALGVRSPADAL